MSLKNRSLGIAVVLVALVASGWAFVAAQQSPAASGPLPAVTTYKDPNCGCCSLWVKHMEQAGFTVTAVDVPNMPEQRAKLGVPQNLQSCHTSVVDGFVVEGHVPAEDVKRLLTSRPSVKGITVPGMPVGSPGMEQGSMRQAYSVFTFDASGQTTVFARH